MSANLRSVGFTSAGFDGADLTLAVAAFVEGLAPAGEGDVALEAVSTSLSGKLLAGGPPIAEAAGRCAPDDTDAVTRFFASAVASLT